MFMVHISSQAACKCGDQERRLWLWRLVTFGYLTDIYAQSTHYLASYIACLTPRSRQHTADLGSSFLPTASNRGMLLNPFETDYKFDNSQAEAKDFMQLQVAMTVPKFKLKVAAAHLAPVFMDKEATTVKVINSIRDAGAQGIDLLAFPETFIPGYPV